MGYGNGITFYAVQGTSRVGLTGECTGCDVDMRIEAANAEHCQREARSLGWVLDMETGDMWCEDCALQHAPADAAGAPDSPASEAPKEGA